GTGAYPILVTIYHDANGSQFLDAGDVQIAQYTETSASAPARQVPHARGQEDFVLVFDGQGGCYDLSIPLNCPAAIVLPVTLQSFNLQRNGSSIALRWSTLTEVNNRGFYVQRMQGNGRWENVTFVASQATGGNSTNVISYSFNDMNSYRGISQYRLYQVDIDGRGRYSDIRSTRGEGTISKLLVFPNPSMGVANLQFANADGARDVQVADMSGRVVKQWRNTGSQSLQVSGLTPGIYTVRVVELRDGSQQTERLVVSGNR
ncbi:MAG: T9SS type A sorting domain-containing protein, partial [Chitinophagaceae bacterium]